MINNIFNNIVLFIVLVLVQILILNNILFSGYINPFVYILFILLLPFEISGWLLLVLSFFMGLSIDMFANTMGMHAASSVFMGFCRPYILSYISPREGYPFESRPAISYMGLNWYLSYSGILVLLHHFCLFYIEIFRFNEFLPTLSRVVFSSCFTLLIIIIIQYLFYSKK